MNYTDFLAAYSEIIALSCHKLKNNRFAVFVVGDIRDKKGAYRDFVSETKRIFKNNGLCLYNEFILLEQYGTAPMRAGATFRAKRKAVKVHQNVLVFYKGNIKDISEVNNNFSWADLTQYVNE
jgi:hypothetical protein